MLSVLASTGVYPVAQCSRADSLDDQGTDTVVEGPSLYFLRCLEFHYEHVYLLKPHEAQ